MFTVTKHSMTLPARVKAVLFKTRPNFDRLYCLLLRCKVQKFKFLHSILKLDTKFCKSSTFRIKCSVLCLCDELRDEHNPMHSSFSRRDVLQQNASLYVARHCCKYKMKPTFGTERRVDRQSGRISPRKDVHSIW